MNGREMAVIIDATGLSLNQYGQWIRVRNGKRKAKRKFIKIHFAVDRDTGKFLSVSAPKAGNKKISSGCSS